MAKRSCRNATSVMSAFGADLVGSLLQRRKYAAAARWRLTFWRGSSKGLQLAPDAVIAANWVDNGPGWLAVLLRSRGDVMGVRPNYAALSGLRVGVVGAWDSAKDGSDAQFEVRAFTAGGYEDPVTGSLNAGLAQWLIGAGIAPSTYVVYMIGW